MTIKYSSQFTFFNVFIVLMQKYLRPKDFNFNLPLLLALQNCSSETFTLPYKAQERIDSFRDLNNLS